MKWGVYITGPALHGKEQRPKRPFFMRICSRVESVFYMTFHLSNPNPAKHRHESYQPKPHVSACQLHSSDNPHAILTSGSQQRHLHGPLLLVSNWSTTSEFLPGAGSRWEPSLAQDGAEQTKQVTEELESRWFTKHQTLIPSRPRTQSLQQ